MDSIRTLKKTLIVAYKEKLLGKIFIVSFFAFSHTILSTLQLMVEKNLIDKIYKISDNTMKSLILYIILFFILKNVLNVVWTTRFLYRITFEPRLGTILRTRMIEKISRLDLMYFEDSELFNLIEKAKSGWFYAVVAFSSAYQTVFGHISTVIGVAIYLSYLKPILILIVLFSAAPKVINYIYRGKKKLELENEQAPIRRRCDYYNDCITDKKYFKETRLFGSFDYFKNLWENSIKTLNFLEWKNTLKLYPMELLINLISFLSNIATFSLAIFYLYKGDISIGAFAAVLSSLDLLDFKIGKILSNLKKVLEGGAMGANYFTFMELEEKKSGYKKTIMHPIDSIEFKNVSFTYPSLNRNVIDNLSLNIKKGETIAMVGLNGSGKTTFIKLLLGLLKPTSGKVIYNGIDISEIDKDYLNIGTSALFQTFGKYMMSVKENIAISEANRMDSLGEIKNSLEFVDFNIDNERFIDEIETNLGKKFGGTDLSGGQWQLLALARAYFRQNDLIILDEPTSAIDPILENEIFKNFEVMSKDKTAIIVTHRLGASKIADRVIVFENGRIIEDGHHENLMSKQGKYAELFKGQSHWYDRVLEVKNN